MPNPRRALAAGLTAALLVAGAVAGGAAGAASDDPIPTTFVGIDGLPHPFSPFATTGQDGFDFLGEEFDTACAVGSHLEGSLERLSRLARILSKAGKRVVFTVAPNKSAVLRDDLPVPLPQQSCGREGMRLQADLLDTYDDPRYVDLRRDLVATPRAYWHTDSHWSTNGAAVFARRVAEQLDPALADGLRYRRVKRTRLGDLGHALDGTPETLIGKVPANGVRTRAASGSAPYDPTLTSISTDYSWVSAPARKTYPGRTLLIGDSFTYVASEALTNLFRKGRFIWTGTASVAAMAQAIGDADTVVFAVVQRYAAISPLQDLAYQNQLKAALRG